MQVMMIVIVVIVVMIMMMRVVLLVGGGIEPGARIGLGVGRIEPFGAQQFADVEGRIVDPRDFCCGIEAAQACGQRSLGLFRVRGIDQIEFGDEDMIGERHLAHGLDVIVERARAVHRIDGRDHTADAIEPGQRQIDKNAWISGDGSASPDVSITT